MLVAEQATNPRLPSLLAPCGGSIWRGCCRRHLPPRRRDPPDSNINPVLDGEFRLPLLPPPVA